MPTMCSISLYRYKTMPVTKDIIPVQKSVEADWHFHCKAPSDMSLSTVMIGLLASDGQTDCFLKR